MKLHLSVCSIGLALAAVGSPVSALGTGLTDPLRFFEGSTEAVTTMTVLMRKPFTSHSFGRGKIAADGSLELVQHVSEQGRGEFDRLWRIHEVRPGHFAGTMSEARGPVSIDRVGNGYRFRFRLADNLSAEQWLTPAGDAIALTQMTVRKFGVAVAHSEGWVRRAQ